MAEIALIVAAASLAVLVWLALGFARLRSSLKDPVAAVAPLLEEKHRAMLTDLHIGLTQQGDRLGRHLTDSSERLSAKIDQRLDQIAGKVDERLDEGFKKTNETFVNVMQRLATIDEAQKKIETLTGSVVSLQELLGDKRSRGAFGEVQLEALVRNVLPPAAFELQYTLSNGMRVDWRAASSAAHRIGDGGLEVSPGELPPHVRPRGGPGGARARAKAVQGRYP